MKKLFLLAVLFVSTHSMFSQNSDVSTLNQSFGRIIDMCTEKNLEVVKFECDLIRTSKESIRKLDPSFTYSIIAIGSDRITDIDIAVYKFVNYQWIEVVKDNSSESTAAVNIKPDEYVEYKVVVTAYKFTEGNDVGHYGLMFIHD